MKLNRRLTVLALNVLLRDIEDLKQDRGLCILATNVHVEFEKTYDIQTSIDLYIEFQEWLKAELPFSNNYYYGYCWTPKAVEPRRLWVEGQLKKLQLSWWNRLINYLIGQF